MGADEETKKMLILGSAACGPLRGDCDVVRKAMADPCLDFFAKRFCLEAVAVATFPTTHDGAHG